MDFDWKQINCKLQAILDDEVAKGNECGCQLAIWQHGELKCDIFSGFADPEHKIPVDKDTFFPIYSSGKPLLATALLQEVEKGTISLDTKVADIWKEFGCNGKEEIKIFHLLTHQSGLHILPKISCNEDMADWDGMCSKIAAQTPRSKPGENLNYHGVTFAWLLGNVLAILQNRPLYEVMKENIIKPCGIEKDLCFGTDDDAESRFALIDESAVEPLPSWHTQTMHKEVIRRACIPSFNGCGTARGLAKFYAVLGGTIPGKRLISSELLNEATMSVRHPYSAPIPENAWTQFGLGMALGGAKEDRARLFGHGGAAGAEGLFDRKTGMALGFVKNKLLMAHPVHPVRDRISEVLGLPIRHW